MLDKINDISSWVNDAEIDKKESSRREAIHILLDAIASSEKLNVQMAMKGGVLLAIKYSSSRHTIDVDFSTSQTSSRIDLDEFIKELNKRLMLSSETLTYGMSCQVQNHKMDPKDPNATYPTFKIKIGYAYKTDRNNYKKFLNEESNTIIKIDYSFNEIIQNTETLQVGEGKSINTYNYYDLIAEKYRAILQQEQRNRHRSQDIYDIYYILTNFEHPNSQDQEKILQALIKKSMSRELTIDSLSMRNPEIKRRSKIEYKDLEKTIYDDLPEFEKTYQFIQDFYEGLPWENKEFKGFLKGSDLDEKDYKDYLEDKYLQKGWEK